MFTTLNAYTESSVLSTTVFESSAAGSALKMCTFHSKEANNAIIQLFPEQTFQRIIGFGGSFTKSSAYLLNQMSAGKRGEIINAYFGDSGSQYSLTRTHINSCDFSLSHYSYAPIEDDYALDHFSIAEDREDIIPFIKEAMLASSQGFHIISSPWTAPPWMKDNKHWVGGKLLPKYYNTWALFFSKYIDAYRAEGIPIWGITVENEPLGNDNNWESMHYTAEEMTAFVQHHLGPTLEANGNRDIKILGYDQNRAHLNEWVDAMYKDAASAKYFDGTAIHWYASTFEVFPEALQYAHKKAPDKYLIQTEACIDAEVPRWRDDAWYWQKEATDWGWDWAPEEDKKYHPKYVPVFRYARDIIGCLNNWVSGWVDWNMVLDRQGGPNWFKNWCVAPIIVDIDKDEVYYTPLYYTLAHFSKYIRPGAARIGYSNPIGDLQITAALNLDGSIAVILLNQSESRKDFTLALADRTSFVSISPKAIQTIIIQPEQ